MSRAVILILGTLALAGCTVSTGSRDGTDGEDTPRAAGESLTGDYEFSSGDERNDVSLMVRVTREAGDTVLYLQAAHPDAHGAAPDGSGTGKIDADGVFRFAYEDSFENRGTGTFRRVAKGYALSIEIKEVSDSRCLRFYGEFVLRRVDSTQRR